jgi:hypothetical protein
MGFITDCEYEIKNDSNRYLEFINIRAVDYTEYIRIELRKKPTVGFKDIHPVDLYRMMKFPRLEMILIQYFIKLVGYVYNHYDLKNNLEEKVYYRCYRFYHHSHDLRGEYDKDELMTLDNAMKWVEQNNLSLNILNEE